MSSCPRSSIAVCHVFTWCRCRRQQLEALLPPRGSTELPTGENVMEVDLMDYEPNARGGHERREAYEEDDDEEHAGAGPRVQCAHQ